MKVAIQSGLRDGWGERLAGAQPRVSADVAACFGRSQIRWRGGRVVEGGGLENRWAGLTLSRGFESHPLRFAPLKAAKTQFLQGMQNPIC